MQAELKENVSWISIFGLLRCMCTIIHVVTFCVWESVYRGAQCTHTCDFQADCKPVEEESKGQDQIVTYRVAQSDVVVYLHSKALIQCSCTCSKSLIAQHAVMHTSIQACFLFFFYNPCNFHIYLPQLFFHLLPATFMFLRM